MPRIRITVLAAASLVALAACSDSPPLTGPGAGIAPSLDASPNTPARRIFELRTANYGAKPGGGGRPGSGTGINYHGGPVFQSGTNVVAIYWAGGPIYNGGPAAGSTGTGAADGSVVGAFLRGLGGSPYFNINSTYTDGSGRAIANSVTYVGYWANNANVPANGQTVTDADMANMLAAGFASGKLHYQANTLYAIFTAGTVNLGGGFGTQYCAYHTHATVATDQGSQTVLYAAMPYDWAYPSGCSAVTSATAPNNDPAADAEVNTLAHETEETTTDEMGNAWYDRRGYENADKCAWNFGTETTGHGSLNPNGVWNITVGGADYLVQQNWVNAGSGGCLQHWP